MRFYIAGLVSGILFVSNAYALGDGFNYKGLDVKPTIRISEEYDDNLTRSTTAIKASWLTIVNPALDIVAGSDARNITVHYDMERGNDSGRNDSYTDHSAGGGVHSELTSRIVMDASVSYNKGHDPRGAIFTGIVTGFTTPNKWHEASTNALLSYGGKNAKGRIVLDGAFSERRYENNRAFTVTRDLNVTEIGTAFYYKILPKTSAFVRGSYTSLDYKLVTSLLDSIEFAAFGGLTWEATKRTNGTIEVGLERKKFNSGVQASTNNLSWNVLIDWSPMTYSTRTLSSGYNTNETDGAGFFIKTVDLNLEWSHLWNTHLQHSINVGYQQDTYVGIGRKDNSILTDFGLTYTVSSWLNVVATYSFSKRSSNAANVDYNQNVYSLTLIGQL